MMEWITTDDSVRWDGIVKSFPAHDVYYLSGYVKAFAAHGDGEPVLLYFSDDHGGRAICVIMVRDVADAPLFSGRIPPGKYHDAVTPYGYGGFVFDGKVDTSAINREFNDILRKRHVNSVFFRFHPVLDNAALNKAIAQVIPLGKTISLDLRSPEVIWENITSKNRNMIRKAEKNGVEIHHSSSAELLAAFKEIYDDTMRRDDADAYYFFNREFYDSINRDLSGHHEIFYASHGDRIISMAIMIFAAGRMNYHLAGSLPEYRNLAPSNLLLYKAALWGHQQGFATFHLGGGLGSGEDRLYKFKAAFNRNSDCRFAIGKAIIIPDDYNKLLQMRGFTEEELHSVSYFPKYRARLD